MEKSTRPSPSRLQEILRRQDPPGFGAHYVPAIKASREEAPARSRPAWVWWDRAQRYLSTLSSVERAILMVCLYNDRIWEIHDQRMLPALPRPHPLAGHPKADGLVLSPMRGTLEIAENLGVLPFHPIVHVPADGGLPGFTDVPFPWVGDFLLFLDDDEGPYCVNLTIKAHPDDFAHAEVAGPQRVRQANISREKAMARHAVEQQVYADAGIRTVRLTQEDYDAEVVATLTQLHLWHRRKASFDADQRRTILDNFQAALANGIPLLEVLYTLSTRYGWNADALKVAFFQAVWQRELRVDLYSPIFIDQPLKPETRDVLDVYGHWFRRS